MEEYFKHVHAFEKRLNHEPISKREARYLLFRIACPLMQRRLPKFVDLTKVPVTFIHGNPHLDNYVKTNRGSAMMDFDRSRMGPYCWDIIRFLGSLSLRRQEQDGFLDHRTVEYFLDAYITHFLNPEIPAKQLKLLKSLEPQKWQSSTREYLKANRRWAKKMRENAISPKSEQAVVLLQKFFEARKEESLLQDYYIDELGHTPGSLGKKHFIYSLMPKNRDSRQDAIMMDIKEVYEEKDNKFFFTPFPHHGQRMIEASRLYADGMEERQSFCTISNKQYWGRQIPSFAMKVKKDLDIEETHDFAYSVGSELGKGHRKGLKDPAQAEILEKDLTKNFDHYYKVSQFLTSELNLAFESMIRYIQLKHDFKSW